jgi:glycosyltransferase involved in cell wall biosynthesis
MVLARMRRSLVLRVLIRDAIISIRRRGLRKFIRRLLSVRSWMPLVFAAANAGHGEWTEGESVIGGIDTPNEAGVSRSIGQISGWALANPGAIDRITIHVDGHRIANARICQPRHDIRSDLPEARICGFQLNLHPDQMPADQDTISVEIEAHTTRGESRRLPPSVLRLARQETANGPATPPDLQQGTPLRSRKPANPRIKVAVFTHELSYGGGQLYLQELLRQLAHRADLEGIVRCPSDGPLCDELARLGYHIEICRAPSLLNAADHDRETDAVRRWLSERDIDCVIANTLGGYYAINAAADAGIPNVWAIHESFPLETWSAYYTHELPGSEFFLSRIKAALRRCSTVVFESNATREMFLRYGCGARFLKMPYGIDNSAADRFLGGFDRDSARARLGLAKNQKMILCMATFEPRKQQILLVQAFAEVLPRHPEAMLWLVGDSPSQYSLALGQYLKRKGVDGSVRTVGVAPDPYPWYAMADGYALLSDLESMPRSLLEAMSFGLPALATRVFGIPELIDDERTGLLVEPSSLQSATRGLDWLLNLSDMQRNSIAQAAQEKVRLNYDSQNYAEGYLSLIRGLVDQVAVTPRS